MRDQWLVLAAALAGLLMLPEAAAAQTMTVPPSWAPSLAQSPTMPSPDQFAPAPDAAPANAAAAPANPPPAMPATQAAAPSGKASATANSKPVAKKAAGMPKTGKHRSAASAARTPREIVAAIYKVAAGRDGGYDGPSAFYDRRIRRLYFSKGLGAAVAICEKKAAGGSILNFDPITNSEAPDVEDLDIAAESGNPGVVSVAARFNSQSDSSVIHYDFVKEGKLWKLDNIRGEIAGQEGQWSLREILKNGAQQS